MGVGGKSCRRRRRMRRSSGGRGFMRIRGRRCGAADQTGSWDGVRVEVEVWRLQPITGLGTLGSI